MSGSSRGRCQTRASRTNRARASSWTGWEAKRRRTRPRLARSRQTAGHTGGISPWRTRRRAWISRGCSRRRPAVAYACARIHSPVDTKAAVLLGSDDGVKLWVNGELVHTRHLARGVKRDEDRADISLKRGANAFVFKVDQGEGGWGLVARIVRPDGTPASVVTQKVKVLPPQDVGGDEPVRFVRASAGKKGSLDVGAAIEYGRWLPKAARWFERFRSVARDPEKLGAALASGTKNVDAALAADKDADALSLALKRAVEDVRNRYGHAREPLLRQMQSPPPLVDADPKNEDFLKQAPGGRYFVRADGSPFLPIGYNHNPLAGADPVLPAVRRLRPRSDGSLVRAPERTGHQSRPPDDRDTHLRRHGRPHRHVCPGAHALGG